MSVFSEYLGAAIGIAVSDTLLSSIREQRAECVEALAKLRHESLEHAPWIIYLAGTGMGLGIASDGRGWMTDCFDVPSWCATRLSREIADRLMSYAEGQGLMQTPRGMQLRVVDVREAISESIALADKAIRDIEKAQRPVRKFMSDYQLETDAPTKPQDKPTNNDNERHPR